MNCGAKHAVVEGWMPHCERCTFQTQGGGFQAQISGQNFRTEAGEFQTHVRGVSDAHNGAFQTHYGIMV